MRPVSRGSDTPPTGHRIIGDPELLEIAERGLSRAHFVDDDPARLESELQEHPEYPDLKKINRLVSGPPPELLDMEPRHLLGFKGLQPGCDAAIILALQPL